MQKRILATLLLVFALTLGKARADDKDDVLNTEAAFERAKLHNDVAALENLLANDFIEINQWGVVRDRRGMLQLFKTFHTTSLVSSDVSVRLSGDTATVIGNMFESGLDRFMFLQTYVKRHGEWQVFSVAQTFRVDSDTLKVIGHGKQAVHPVTGRVYAGMMGMSGADWLVRPERQEEEEPDKAIAALDIAPGSTVADIGAGVGYFSWRLAKVVGPTGKVYANEIQSGMIDNLKKNMQERSIANVEPVLGKLDDPMLPKGAIDLALLVDVYHEFSEPQKMLDRIRESLKPDGRLVLLEYRKEDSKLPINALHKMSVAEVKAEVEPEGYKLDKTLEILPRQHILIFKVRVM
jgi:precorrin-6B methylase 2